MYFKLLLNEATIPVKYIHTHTFHPHFFASSSVCAFTGVKPSHWELRSFWPEWRMASILSYTYIHMRSAGQAGLRRGYILNSSQWENRPAAALHRYIQITLFHCLSVSPKCIYFKLFSNLPQIFSLMRWNFNGSLEGTDLMACSHNRDRVPERENMCVCVCVCEPK